MRLENKSLLGFDFGILPNGDGWVISFATPNFNDNIWRRGLDREKILNQWRNFIKDRKVFESSSNSIDALQDDLIEIFAEFHKSLKQ